MNVIPVVCERGREASEAPTQVGEQRKVYTARKRSSELTGQAVRRQECDSHKKTQTKKESREIKWADQTG